MRFLMLDTLFYWVECFANWIHCVPLLILYWTTKRRSAARISLVNLGFCLQCHCLALLSAADLGTHFGQEFHRYCEMCVYGSSEKLLLQFFLFDGKSKYISYIQLKKFMIHWNFGHTVYVFVRKLWKDSNSNQMWPWRLAKIETFFGLWMPIVI